MFLNKMKAMNARRNTTLAALWFEFFSAPLFSRSLNSWYSYRWVLELRNIRTDSGPLPPQSWHLSSTLWCLSCIGTDSNNWCSCTWITWREPQCYFLEPWLEAYTIYLIITWEKEYNALERVRDLEAKRFLESTTLRCMSLLPNERARGMKNDDDEEYMMLTNNPQNRTEEPSCRGRCSRREGLWSQTGVWWTY